MTEHNTETTTDEQNDEEPTRIPPLNLTKEEAAYLWEMMKEEVGKEEVQYGDDRDTAESLHTKVRQMYFEKINDETQKSR